VKNGEEETNNFTKSTTSDVSTIEPEIQNFNLYATGHNSKQSTRPFIHQLNINSGIGGAINVWATFDDGALTNALSTTKFDTIKHRLGCCKPSHRWLRMADGCLVKPKAVWEGKMEIEGVQVFGSFEVFDSGGNWEFLLGKPLLTALHATHEYTGDTIAIKNNGVSALLRSQFDIVAEAPIAKVNPRQLRKPTRREHDREGKRILPLEEAQVEPFHNDKCAVDVAHIEIDHSRTLTGHINKPHDMPTEIEVDTLRVNNDIFTRLTDLWKIEHVEEILKQVKIGTDLTEEERTQVRKFISGWADVFALSINASGKCDSLLRYSTWNNILNEGRSEAANATTKKVPL
jgi:hypothetical protein